MNLLLLASSGVFYSLLQSCLCGEQTCLNPVDFSPCNYMSKIWPKFDCFNESAFYDCVENFGSKFGETRKFLCPKIEDIQTVFDGKSQRCQKPITTTTKESLHLTTFNYQPSSAGRVGDACSVNTDCISSGMRCSAGVCACTNNFFQRNRLCYPTEPQCVQGKAAKDSFGAFIRCSTNGTSSICPTNYECSYDGIRYGCCPTRVFTCSLTFDAGNVCSTAPSTRWFFNNVTQSCDSFMYNGCDGNSNNFAFRSDCQTYCAVGTCPNGGPVLTDINESPRFCSSAFSCPSSHECVTITLSSALTVSTVNYCCQTKSYICSLKNSVGTVCSGSQRDRATTIRYYFDATTKKCNSFAFNGCGGNANNFATQIQCINFCNSVACLSGETAFIDASSQQAIVCTNNSDLSCPQGYTCRTDFRNQRSICCGSSSMGICPTGERAFVDSLTGSARLCNPGLIAGACPINFLCRYNTILNNYFCCISTTGEDISKECASGSLLVTGGIKNTCSTTSSCPSGYTCQQSSTPGISYCCSVDLYSAVQDVCGNGTAYQPENIPVSCNPKDNSCPSGYICQMYNFTNSYFCCRSPVQGNCPVNTQASLDPTTGKPQTCTPDGTPCQISFTCQQSSVVGVYLCCSTPANLHCPSGQTAYINSTTGQIQECLASRCPSPYVCTLAQQSLGYLCCSPLPSDSLCPFGLRSYNYPGTSNPLVCTDNRNGCPVGSSCHLNAAKEVYYCCISNASVAKVFPINDCPSASAPLMMPDSDVPESCSTSIDTPACPDGYKCRYSKDRAQYVCCSMPTSVNHFSSTPLKPKTCRRKPCRAGEYGCKSGKDCSGPSVHCDNGRCTCPRHLLLSSEGKCVAQCSANQINIDGECVSVFILNDSLGRNQSRELNVKCTNRKKCQIRNAFCNSANNCQCEKKYKPLNSTNCVSDV